jgi:hypothetical protein
MIYLIGNKESFATIFDDTTLTEEQKKSAFLVLKDFPPCEEKEGYFKELKIDNDNKPYWVYHKNRDFKELVKQQAITVEDYKRITGLDYIE